MTITLKLLGALAVLTAQTASEDLAIVGGKIEVGDGQVIPAGTILVRAGKIEKIGAAITVPSSYRQIDVKGCVVYPGFVDAYTTRGMVMPPVINEGRVQKPGEVYADMDRWNRKGVRPEVSAAGQGQLPDSVTQEYIKAGFASAAFFPEAGILGGTGSLIDFGVGPWTNRVTAPAIGVAFGFGGAALDQRPPAYPSTMLGAVAQFRQVMISASEVHGFDPALEALKPVLSAAKPLVMTVTGRAEAQRARSLAKSNRVKSILLLRGMVEPEDLQEQDLVVGLDLNPADMAKLAKAGLKFAFASKVGSTTDDILSSVRKAVRAGMPRDAALRSLTSEPRRLYGSQYSGILAVGQEANLTIFTGDFTDEKSLVRAVLVRGVEVSR